MGYACRFKVLTVFLLKVGHNSRTDPKVLQITLSVGVNESIASPMLFLDAPMQCGGVDLGQLFCVYCLYLLSD